MDVLPRFRWSLCQKVFFVLFFLRCKNLKKKKQRLVGLSFCGCAKTSSSFTLRHPTSECPRSGTLPKYIVLEFHPNFIPDYHKWGVYDIPNSVGLGNIEILLWNRRTPQRKANPTREKLGSTWLFGPLFLTQQMVLRGLVGFVLYRKQTTRSLTQSNCPQTPW